MEAHLRIDEGIPKATSEAQQRAVETGEFLPICSTAARKIIIDDAISSLETGETTDSIAIRHGVAGRTLRYWLMADDRTDQARANMFMCRLLEAAQAIDDATAPLPLARAREQFRAWSFLAERRAPRHFGQQQMAVNVNAPGQVTIQVVSYASVAAPALSQCSEVKSIGSDIVQAVDDKSK